MASPLVGRDPIVAQLRSALDAARHGCGGCLIIDGQAGMGKTRLLSEAAQQARRLGYVVANARATVMDRIAPLTTLLMALRESEPLVLDDAGLATLESLRSQGELAFWVGNQLSIRIRRYASTHPLMISIDDAHWADEMTALALRILVPALRDSHVLWLLTSRPLANRSPAHEVIDWLAGEGAMHLSLGPLSDRDIVRLSREILGSPPSPEILALARRTGGNPLLLEELITAFKRSGWTQREEQSSGLGDGSELPRALLESVEFRLGRLSLTARQVLETGAVLGHTFALADVVGITGRKLDEVHDAVTEIVDEGILIGNGPEVEFRHDLIRDVIYSRLSDSARQVLHAEVAKLLLANHRPVVEITTHLVRGARQGDTMMLSILRQAALDLAPISPNTAADLMLRVLTLLDYRDPDRPDLAATAVRLLASAGRLVEARELGEAAMRFPLSDATSAAMLLGLAEAQKHAGQMSLAVEYTRRALSRPAIPAALQAHLLAVRAHALLVGGDFQGADDAAKTAVEVGTSGNEHAAVVFGMAARSVVSQSRGQIDEAIRLAGDAVKLTAFAGGEAKHRHPRLWLARALLAADRFADAAAELKLAEQQIEESGTALSMPHWHLVQAQLHLALGNLDDAQVAAESGAAVADQLSALAPMPALLSLLGLIAVHRNEIPAAAEHLRRGWQFVQRDGRWSDTLLWSKAVMLEEVGEAQSAVRTVSPLYARLPRDVRLLTLCTTTGPYLVRLARSTGRIAQAQVAAVGTCRLAELNQDSVSLRSAAAQADGVLRDDVSALRAAVDSYRASARRLAQAAALEDAGVAESTEGRDAGEAHTLLEDAHQHYSLIGARRDAARVERRLRGLSSGRRAHRLPARVRFGWDSLTQSELRVIKLVAQGMTNRVVAERLYLSPHTVDSHLRHAFAKLGVSTRVALTRAVLLNSDSEAT
jgi:DNA-binding CsgD family transcriptional regulator/tetratricopeptide (TPR) repeat protein